MDSLAVYNHSYGSVSSSYCMSGGLPEPLGVTSNNGISEITPPEGGSVAYGLGRALRLGYDALSPAVSSAFEWATSWLPSIPTPFDLPVASAAKIPQPQTASKVELQARCKMRTVNRIALPNQYDGNMVNWGNLAVIANGKAGLQLVDIGFPKTPFVTAGYNTSGFYAGWNGVAASMGLAFVNSGSDSDGSGSVAIMNISDPFHPYPIASWNNGMGSPLWMSASETTLYITNQYDVGAHYSLVEVNITNPVRPKWAGQISYFDQWFGPFALLGDHFGVQARGSDKYLSTNRTVAILDLNNDSVVSTLDTSPRQIADIVVDGTDLFLLATPVDYTTANTSLVYWVNADNFSDPRIVTTYEFPPDYHPNDIDYSESKLFSLATPDFMGVDVRIFDTDQNRLSVSGSYIVDKYDGTRFHFNSFFVSSGYVYILSLGTPKPFVVLNYTCV